MPVPSIDTIDLSNSFRLHEARFGSGTRSPSPLQGKGRGEGRSLAYREVAAIRETSPPFIPPAKGDGIESSGVGSVDSKLVALREVAGKTVGSAFYGTIFQMMRESPFKTEIGSGGRGEEVFSAQLHGVLAERLGESKQCNLSDVLYRRLEKQQRLIDVTGSQRNRE